ncbi:MAG: LysR family transcriptional regulator [Anaerolineae bacterium]|nr:LysR family transcriptional regulator [Anaerolineae bacterium]
MDETSLYRFVVIVESGSLSRAAARLKVTQPALTRTLQSLESRFGAQLLRRGAGGVLLTPYGEALLMRAKLILAELRYLDSEVDALRNLATGVVKVGVPSGLGFTSEVLPAATLPLLTDESRLELSYMIGTRDHLLRALRHGDLDFVVAETTHGSDASDLAQERLFSDHSAVIVRADHPLAARRRIPVSALITHPWIVLSDSDQLETVLRGILAEQNAQVKRSVLRSNSALFVRSAVSKTNAVGLMSLDAARTDLRNGLLMELVVEHRGQRVPLPTRELGVVYRRDAVLSSAALALIGELRRQCDRRAGRKPQPTRSRASH